MRSQGGHLNSHLDPQRKLIEVRSQGGLLNRHPQSGSEGPPDIRRSDVGMYGSTLGKAPGENYQAGSGQVTQHSVSERPWC